MRNTGKQIQQVPTWTQAERNKTEIPVRNTLSQLHWLHHSVNTQYRQALIANIWWVWIYKIQSQVLPAPPHPRFTLHMLVFVHTVWRCRGSDFPLYTLWPRVTGWGVRTARPLFPPTHLNHIRPSLVSGSGVLGGSWVAANSPSAPGGAPDPHFGEWPPPNQVNDGWPHMKDGPARCHANYCQSQVRPATGATDFTNQSHPSTWTDGQ